LNRDTLAAESAALCYHPRRARRLVRPRPVNDDTPHREVRTLAKTPRKWTGARSPSGLKRVRSSERRHAILGPRRATAKTLVKNALSAAIAPSADVDPQVALTEAISALDRAAKVGAIHPNAAARRKSRLVRKVNAAGVGAGAAGSHVAKTIGRAAAQKAAKARIAASKADKAKGAQTAAGKARAALSKSSRAEAAAATAAAKASATAVAKASKAPAKAASKPASKASAKPASKASAKPAAKAAAAKTTAAKKAPAKKAAKA
jgi:ribosomal protein S20